MSHQENKRFLSCSYTPKEGFVAEYIKLYHGKPNAKELYLQILSELKKAIEEGSVVNFKNLSKKFCCINTVEEQATLRTYYNDTDNPIVTTNLVILACKHNKVDILKYILGNNDVSNSLSLNVGKVAIAPDDEDESCHNAFYYAIRSGNAKLLDALINKWPDNYFVVNSGELDEILSRSYEELKLRNVPLRDEIEIFVESTLINLRFYSDGKIKNVTNSLSNIKERIGLVLENINLLQDLQEVDQRFLFVTNFVAQNIHILKRQLKSTYKSLPWEEIEFCLISFVSSHTKRQEINLFYRATLNTAKMLKHLRNFGNRLKNEKYNIESMDFIKNADLPNLKREKLVADIIVKYPEFEELYNDYQQIRDMHSLEKISNYIKLALSADPGKKEGQLIITRALQIIGECLKNTLESPKLSNTTSELLLLSLPNNTREIIIDLRNSLSHTYSLSKRTEIEEKADINFFTSLQNDTKKINNVITDILYENKIKTIRGLLQKIMDSESFEERREVGEILHNIKLDDRISGTFPLMEHEKLEKLIKELSDCISEKTEFEKELFRKIHTIISFEKTKLENISTDYFMGFTLLKSTRDLLGIQNIDSNIIKEIKFYANKTLENIAPKIESHSIKEIANLSTVIFHSVVSRLQDNDEITRLFCEIFHMVEFGIDNIKWIEELRERLNEGGSFILERKQKKTYYSVTSGKYNDQLTLKLSELRDILNNNALSNRLIENFPSYKNNKKLQAVVEMLVLDITSILSSSKDYLTNNMLFLDDKTPLLTGKCLRNHLAHDNALLDVLCFDPSMAIILNAKKLTTENIFQNNEKIGKSVREDPSKLKEKFNQGLEIITNQKRMFVALEEGNFHEFMSCLQKGADIHARNINSWTTLHYAAKGSELEVVKFLLSHNLSVNVKDVNGQNPLHIAAMYGRKSIVEYFVVDMGLSVNDVDNGLKTPLHIAAENGHKHTVKVLLQNQANTTTKSMSGLSPLHSAVRNNHIDVVKVLVEQDPDVDCNVISGGYTSLHEASERGYLDIVKFLLKNKADVNAKNDRNWTPLHAASLNGRLEIVKALVSQGPDVNARVIDGCTPLHYAVENGHEDIADVLLAHGANVNVGDKSYGITPLHYAAKDGHMGILKSLLKKNANAFVVSVYGLTPLHFAAAHGHVEIVAALLERGVDINAKSKYETTPLYSAVENGYKEVADILIQNKANVNVRGSDNLTPLHIAAVKGYKDIIGLLIKNKAKVDARDIDGHTPLHLAAANSTSDIVDFLIKSHANIGARSKCGFTPLHSAALSGRLDTIVCLLQNNAEVNNETYFGSTPLHAAAKGGHKDVVSFLIKQKALVNASGIAESTPLHTAIEAGHKEVVEVLIANGANINIKSNEIAAPLSSAVKHNCKEIVQVLIAKGADVNVDDGEPLSLAVLAGYRDIVQILLKNKAAVNTKSAPLHLAAIGGHKGIVNDLIANGADVNAVTDTDKDTALHQAAIHGHDAIVEVLLNNGAHVNLKDKKNRTPLELAVICDHLRVVRTLLQHEEVDVNAKCNDDWTILHIAAQEGRLEIARFLVEKGANMNAKNDLGSKPIHIAARDGNIDVLKFFLSKGLDINELGAANSTLLHYAAMGSQVEIVKYLIAQGVDVNKKDSNGSTPIHTAANSGSKDVIEVLLSNGAIYNAVDNFGRKPLDTAEDNVVIDSLSSTEKLFRAVKHNSPSEVENCIKAGAFVNAKNADNGTPLHYAAWKGYDGVVDVLLQNKASPNVVGNKGFTPLHYAAKFSHLKVVKVLLCNGAIYDAVSDGGNVPLDFSVDKKITHLFKLVGDSFNNVKNGNSKVVKDLKALNDIDTVKAVLNSRNRENKTLVVTAVENNFPKVKQLKELLQDDLSIQLDLADLLILQEHYPEALNILQDALEKRTEILGPDNPGTLDIQEQMAKILYKQYKYLEALSIFEEIYQKRKEMVGINNKDTLNTRSSIALVLHRQANDEKALSIYEEVCQEQKKLLGANHADVLNTQFHMAMVLDKQQKFKEALSIYYELFEKRKEKLGKNHPITLAIQNNIAMVLNNQGNYDEALKIYKRVYETRKVVLGPGHSDTLRTLHNMIAVHMFEKKYDDALKAYKEVFETQKAFLGADHLDTLTTQCNMGNLLLTQGKIVGALKNFKESLDQRRAILGPNHPHILDTEKKIDAINMGLKFQGNDASTILQNLQKDINIAASNGDIETIQSLLRQGADVNDKDTDGRTPLHYAVNIGHIGVVNTLLQNGADVMQATNKGNTPLHTAASKGYQEIVQLLLQHVNRNQLNDFINAQTTVGGATSLHVAAKNGFSEVAKTLINHGAVYNIKNKEGKTPADISKDKNISNLLNLTEELFKGTQRGHVQVVSKLRSLKPDDLAAVTKARNNRGNTLLQVAITNKHNSIAGELLKMLKTSK